MQRNTRAWVAKLVLGSCATWGRDPSTVQLSRMAALEVGIVEWQMAQQRTRARTQHHAKSINAEAGSLPSERQPGGTT